LAQTLEKINVHTTENVPRAPCMAEDEQGRILLGTVSPVMGRTQRSPGLQLGPQQ
jgi:hypothetical protein